MLARVGSGHGLRGGRRGGRRPVARAQQQVELSVDGRSGGHGAVLLLLPFLLLLLAPKRHYLHLEPSRVDLFFVAASGPQDAAILRAVLLLCREWGKRGNRRGATDGGLQQPHCISRVVANAFLVSRKKKNRSDKKNGQPNVTYLDNGNSRKCPEI